MVYSMDCGVMGMTKSKGGRPSKYKPEYAEQAHKLCLLGATDKDLADFFGVDEATINRWKEAHPQFCKSLNEGKVMADANVAHRLYTRAVGYKAEEETYEGGELKKTVVKEVVPDVTAQIFWLKNRQRDKWRDRQEIEANLSAGDLTPEQADALIRGYTQGQDA